MKQLIKRRNVKKTLLPFLYSGVWTNLATGEVLHPLKTAVKARSDNVLIPSTDLVVYRRKNPSDIRGVISPFVKTRDQQRFEIMSQKAFQHPKSLLVNQNMVLATWTTIRTTQRPGLTVLPSITDSQHGICQMATLLQFSKEEHIEQAEYIEKQIVKGEFIKTQLDIDTQINPQLDLLAFKKSPFFTYKNKINQYIFTEFFYSRDTPNNFIKVPNCIISSSQIMFNPLASYEQVTRGLNEAIIFHDNIQKTSFCSINIIQKIQHINRRNIVQNLLREIEQDGLTSFQANANFAAKFTSDRENHWLKSECNGKGIIPRQGIFSQNQTETQPTQSNNSDNSSLVLYKSKGSTTKNNSDYPGYGDKVELFYFFL